MKYSLAHLVNVWPVIHYIQSGQMIENWSLHPSNKNTGLSFLGTVAGYLDVTDSMPYLVQGDRKPCDSPESSNPSQCSDVVISSRKWILIKTIPHFFKPFKIYTRRRPEKAPWWFILSKVSPNNSHSVGWSTESTDLQFLFALSPCKFIKWRTLSFWRYCGWVLLAIC